MIRALFLLTLTLCASISINASESSTTTQNVEDSVYTNVEKMPVFPGGETGLMRFLSENVRYPVEAMVSNIQGRVVVRFVVTKTGGIGDTDVLRSVHPDLDMEAIRVVKALPGFIPAESEGKVVNAWYTIPVNFKMIDRPFRPKQSRR